MPTVSPRWQRRSYKDKLWPHDLLNRSVFYFCITITHRKRDPLLTRSKWISSLDWPQSSVVAARPSLTRTPPQATRTTSTKVCMHVTGRRFFPLIVCSVQRSSLLTSTFLCSAGQCGAQVRRRPRGPREDALDQREDHRRCPQSVRECHWVSQITS